MLRKVLWDRRGSATQPIFETMLPGWQTIASATYEAPVAGLYTIHWSVVLRVWETYAFGLFKKEHRDFEFRIEFAGSYAYAYTSRTQFEPYGSGTVLLQKGAVDSFVLINIPKGSVARVDALRIDVTEVPDEVR